MDGNYVLQQVHDEFARLMESENQRLAEENKRQNARILELEENVKEIHSLTVSVERMAVNMGNMLEEQKKQGDRLAKLEKEPADAYKQIKMSIVTSIIGTIVGAGIGVVIALL